MLAPACLGVTVPTRSTTLSAHVHVHTPQGIILKTRYETSGRPAGRGSVGEG